MRLDLGCGPAKKEGFIGVDSREFKGVDVVHDLGDTSKPWPWQNDTVDEVYCNHLLEHLTAPQRMYFANELCRVLKRGAKAQINVPDWGSGRAYGDPTHQWPPVVPMSFSYWNREWRSKEAPHVDAQNLLGGFACDFDFGAGYGVPIKFAGRNPEFIQFAVDHYLDGRADLMVTVTKR